MNKKLFGISALLALVLAGCNPSPAPTSETPSGTSDTSSTPTATSDTGTSTSEAPQAPELADLFGAFEALGASHSAKVTMGNAVLNYVRNADYAYLDGVGGVAKIEIAEGQQQGGQEGGQEGGAEAQGLAKRSAVSKSSLSVKDSVKGIAGLNNASAVIERDPEGDEGQGQEGGEETQPTVTPAKFFAIYEEKGEFKDVWGAVYTSQEAFDAMSIPALFEDFEEYFTPEQLATYFILPDDDTSYYVADASIIDYFFNYLNLADYAEVLGDGFLELGLDENENPFIGFYEVNADQPTAVATFKADATAKNERLETHIASLTEYPTSPIDFVELIESLGSNFESISDPSDLMQESGYELGYKVNEKGFAISRAGKAWSSLGWGNDYNTGYEWGMADVDPNREIVGGTYTYGVDANKNALALTDINNPDEDATTYFDYKGDKGWDYYAYCPQYALELVEADDFVEAQNSLVITEDNPAFSELQKCFRGTYIGAGTFLWTLKAGGNAITQAKALYFEYSLDEAGKVDAMAVTAELGYLSYDTKTGAVGTEWLDIPESYVVEYFGNFGKIDSFGKGFDFANKEIKEVTIDAEMPSEKVMDVGDTFDVKAALGYQPERASVSFETIYEYSGLVDPVVSVDAEGVLTAIGAGETLLFSTIGGFEHSLDVVVKGLKAYYNGKYAESFNVIPAAEEATEFGFDFFGLDADTVYEISSDNNDFVVAAKAYGEGETAPEDSKEYTVLANNAGEANIKLTATEPNGKKYEASIKVIAAPSVEIAAENAWGTLTKGGSVAAEVLAPKGATVEVTSDNPKVEGSYDATKGAIVFNAVEPAEGSKENACANLTLTLTVGTEIYTDSVKVSVTSNNFVREWSLTREVGEANVNYDILLHEDGSIVVTSGDETKTGTWKLATNETYGYKYAEVTIDGIGSDKFAVEDIEGGDWDNVAAMITYSYEVPAEEEGGDPTVRHDYDLAYKASISRISAYRGNYYGSDSSDPLYKVFGVIDLYVLNDLTYVLYINEEFVAQGDLTESSVLSTVTSDDGLTQYRLVFTVNSSNQGTLAEMKYTRADAESDWAIAGGYYFGKQYAMY